MSRSLEIPDAIFSALKAAAEASGTTPVGWIAAHLSPSGKPADENQVQAEAPKSLAALFVGRVGRIQSGGAATLSIGCADNFADHLEGKRKAKNL